MTRLFIHVADQVGADRPIEVSPFVIGRDLASDVVLDDPRASRRHAQVEVQPDGRVVLRDLGSETGTFVDGARIEGGVWFTVPGSFRVGRTMLDIRLDPGVAADVPTVPAVPVAAAASAPAPVVPYATPVVAAAAVVATPDAAAAAAPAVLWAPVSEATPAVPARFRSSRTRALVAMVVIAIVGVIDAASIIHLATFDRLADDFVNGAVGTAEAEAFDATTNAIAGAYLLGIVVGAIAFVAWLSRAVDNAPAIGAGRGRFSPRAAIGWWFVPIANYFVPYQIVADLHDRLATAMDSDRARPLLVGWWLAWIGGNALSVVARLLPVETLDQISAQYTVAMVSDAVNAGAAILAIFVIQRLVAREDARATAPADAEVEAAPA